MEDSQVPGELTIVQPLQGWAGEFHFYPGCAHFVRDPGLRCLTPSAYHHAARAGDTVSGSSSDCGSRPSITVLFGPEM